MRVMRFGVGPRPVPTVSEQAQREIEVESILLDPDELRHAAAVVVDDERRQYSKPTDRGRDIRSLLIEMAAGTAQLFTDIENVTRPRVDVAVTLPETWRAARLRRMVAAQGRKAGQKIEASVRKGARKGCNALGQRLIGPSEDVTLQPEEKRDQSVTESSGSGVKVLFDGDSVRAQRDAAVAKGAPWYPVVDDELGDLTEFLGPHMRGPVHPETPTGGSLVTLDELETQANNLVKAVEALRLSVSPEQPPVVPVEDSLLPMLLDELSTHYRALDEHRALHLGTVVSDPAGAVRCGYHQTHATGWLLAAYAPYENIEEAISEICQDCWQLRHEDYSHPQWKMNSGDRVLLDQELASSGLTASKNAGRVQINAGRVHVGGQSAPRSKHTYDRSELAGKLVSVGTGKNLKSVLFID